MSTACRPRCAAKAPCLAISANPSCPPNSIRTRAAARQAPPRPLKVLLHDDESAPIPAIDVVERERQVRSGPDGAAAGGGHPGADGAAHSAVAAGHLLHAEHRCGADGDDGGGL